MNLRRNRRLRFPRRSSVGVCCRFMQRCKLPPPPRNFKQCSSIKSHIAKLSFPDTCARETPGDWVLLRSLHWYSRNGSRFAGHLQTLLERWQNSLKNVSSWIGV
ncbi:hypothetical protein QQF64_017572 [Cirrhinus molitorella]|uniref:Uncharacterized protein n=1 Tax=Cirrhinus molitorella TaxID=172907 RepID=A0ABR3LMA8_9TELE